MANAGPFGKKIGDLNIDVNLSKMVEREIQLQTGVTLPWNDLLSRSKARASFDLSLTYDRVYMIIEQFEKRRYEQLHMWPGCDKCKRLYPIVIPEPGSNKSVLAAPMRDDRACMHNADPNVALRFYIPWTEIVLLNDEIIHQFTSKVDEVKLVRRPGNKRTR